MRRRDASSARAFGVASRRGRGVVDFWYWQAIFQRDAILIDGDHRYPSRAAPFPRHGHELSIARVRAGGDRDENPQRLRRVVGDFGGMAAQIAYFAFLSVRVMWHFFFLKVGMAAIGTPLFDVRAGGFGN